MAETSAARVSALDGHYYRGRFGAEGSPGVVLTEVRDLMLHQVAAWPDSLAATGAKAAAAVGAKAAPGPGKAVGGRQGALLRIEPLKFWLFGAPGPELDPEEGASLDLSHSRSHLHIAGAQAAALLNRQLPLDLRANSFPAGSVGSTAFHHVGVTLWRSDGGYELFIPRGFALSLWEMLQEGAAQFGYDVT